MRLLVTGASGFVGQQLCIASAMCRHVVRAALRVPSYGPTSVESISVGEINDSTDWSKALQDIDVVIHLAARVHVMHDTAVDPLSEFRRTNTQGTEHLARCAAARGVKRLVYVSSIKVNGEETPTGNRYSELDAPAPQDPYGVSKWEAEQALWQVSRETGLEVVVVRPPLVYGPGVKGNFLQMLKVLARRWPLPLGAVSNRRDLIYVGNLVDALMTCATHPAAAGHTYLVCDGESVSTTELLKQLSQALGVSPPLLPFPPVLLRWAAALGGKSAQLERLLGSLQIDDGRIRRELGWQPPYTLQQGLQATAAWYKKTDR
jgi:nucleoside-diphosphate-sugar epimerase